MRTLLSIKKFILICVVVVTTNVLCSTNLWKLINIYVRTTTTTTTNNLINYQLIIDDKTLIGKAFNISLKPYHLAVNERLFQNQFKTGCLLLLYGQIDSPNKVQAIISLINCTKNIAYGVLTVDGETYALNYYGNASLSEHTNRRAKRELSTRQMYLVRHDNMGVCGNALREPTPEWYIKTVESREQRDDLSANFGEGMLELAVYVDQRMLTYHSDDYDVVRQFVVFSVAYVQTVLHQRNIEKHVTLNLTIKHFEVIDTEDIDKYSTNEILLNFCDNQYVKRSVADISLLFTGVNLWYTPKGEISSTIVGMANVYSVCKPKMNCLVLEGRSLRSALTLAHEIGHMLGMFHDGDRRRADTDCDDDTYIMSPTVSGGKTQWSECSVRQMRKFFLTLKKDNKGRPLCFQQYPPPYDPYFAIDNIKALRPGLTTDIHKQCQMSFGKGFFGFVDRNTQDICNTMYCWSKVLVVRGHPALEGTKCAHNKYCRRGQCMAGKY